MLHVTFLSLFSSLFSMFMFTSSIGLVSLPPFSTLSFSSTNCLWHHSCRHFLRLVSSCLHVFFFFPLSLTASSSSRRVITVITRQPCDFFFAIALAHLSSNDDPTHMSYVNLLTFTWLFPLGLFHLRLLLSLPFCGVHFLSPSNSLFFRRLFTSFPAFACALLAVCFG